jgi:glutamyl-tRNA synthetase
VGALRTALFDHLFAKKHRGQNIYRVEDTDRNRYSADAEVEFVEALKWAGVEFHEGPHVGGPHAPYRQSERKAAGIYDRWVDELLEQGAAYRAFETPEELAEMREFQQVNKLPIGYFGGTWREASASDMEAADGAGRPFVVRLKMPRNRKITLIDAIRGKLEWDADTLDDQVLIKADGMPTYHFAAIVDDHLMGITHVIRGEEWVSSAPKHAWLYEAFGWEQPVWVHCPVIVGNDGKKLSKRHGATSVLDYRAMGFLPQALMNFVALIGWAPGGDLEVMPGQELVQAFTLEGLQPSPGRFDFEKLKWMNGQYLRMLGRDELMASLLEYANVPENLAYWEGYAQEPGEPSPVQGDPSRVAPTLSRIVETSTAEPAYAADAVYLCHERAATLADFGEVADFFFEEEPPLDPKAAEKWYGQPHVPALFDALLLWLEGRSEATAEECEAFMRAEAERLGLDKLGPAVHPTRVALTGRTTGPGLFELMSQLGPERMRRRLTRARSVLASARNN